MKRPGPKPRPSIVLRDAAILYAEAVEVYEFHPKREWDRLRKAALRYQSKPRAKGRMPPLEGQ